MEIDDFFVCPEPATELDLEALLANIKAGMEKPIIPVVLVVTRREAKILNGCGITEGYIISENGGT